MQTGCDDPFWIHDPLLLVQVDRLVEFYPSVDMCGNERMNAVTRFILYAGVLTAYVKKDIKPIALSLAVVATLAFLYSPKSDKEMLPVYYEQKRMNCVHSNQNNPFMNMLPLDPQYSEKKNMETCTNQQLPDTNSTVQSNTVPSETCEDFARHLYPETMGACKNGNQEACTI